MRVFTRGKRVLVPLIAAALFSQATAGNAGWMDDWYQSKTSTGPSYFEGQARGYVSGGSFSARWPSHTDYPISASPPRLSIGCGGIDAFAGSISFLKPDMMVKKLQNILTNSAFLAFDMALDTLCPKCSALMKAAEDISNKLNAMSINDCNAAKGMVSGLRPLQEGVTAALWEDKGSEAMSKGFTDSLDSYKNMIPSMPTKDDINTWWNSQSGKPPTFVDNVSGCPGILAQLFPSDKTQYPVSVMDTIGDTLGFPRAHVRMMEGLVGDILINDDQSVNYLDACAGNKALDLDSFINGVYEEMDDSGECVLATSDQQALIQYVSTTMQSVADKLKTGTALSDTESAFITSVPVSVLYGLRVGIGSGQESMMISNLSQITAIAWMQRSLQDLLSRADSIMRIAAKANRNFSNGSDTCNLKVAGGNFTESYKTMSQHVTDVISMLNEQSASSMKQFETSFAIAQNLKKLNDEIKNYTSQHFGPSVAARAMRYM